MHKSPATTSPVNRIARRVVLDGLNVTVEWPDGTTSPRTFETLNDARCDAAICASAFSSYVFDRTPQTCLAF